ncbi:MAG: Daunorubicin/doxorubicin resistance ATP-binding protein DrrA [Planctomycetota bacterium]
MLRAFDLHKSFGAARALDGVSIHVQRGEVLGLLGPNGAGKSTTIAVCTGLVAPDAGRVEIGDAGPPTSPAARRLLGLAPQSIALYGSLTARENLVFLARIHGVQDPSARTEELLARVGLLPRADDRVGTFSGGMQRRLNLAAAIVHRPPIVLLDEPTAGVDPQSRTGILELVRELADAGHAVLYTTHYMEEAERVCDRVAIVDHGRVLAEGAVRSMLAEHGASLEAVYLSLTGRSLRD